MRAVLVQSVDEGRRFDQGGAGEHEDEPRTLPVDKDTFQKWSASDTKVNRTFVVFASSGTSRSLR